MGKCFISQQGRDHFDAVVKNGAFAKQAHGCAAG
jgi:hypothetical protein